jgi:hypothetical protein
VTFDVDGLPVVSRYLGSSVQAREESQSETRVIGPPPTAEIARARALGLNTRRLEAFRPTETTTTTKTTTTPIEHSVQIPIGQIMRQYQTSAFVAQQQQLEDIRAIDDYNVEVGLRNDRVTQVLRGVTGTDHGEDPQAWTAWWVDQLGYSYKAPQSQPVPTYQENVPLDYLPEGVATPVVNQAGPSTVTTAVATTTRLQHNCFKAGTPVRTLAGPRPIETICVGDRVLTQDVQTGALGYQPVVAVFHNPPSTTMRIDLDGESIVATTIHRFWKAGRSRTIRSSLSSTCKSPRREASSSALRARWPMTTAWWNRRRPPSMPRPCWSRARSEPRRSPATRINPPDPGKYRDR